ncbi:MAG: TIGR02301 family protein [Hyphomicrobiales bacterium]|nr:TIGR02301 family protein [Hyphomicrobiales bacterium]
MLAAFASAGASAQASGDADAAPELPARIAAPPYESALMRLSEILGAVHYLDSLCGFSDSPVWRDEMLALIDAESPSTQRRAGLVDAFNRGYRGFAEVYRQCTPPARVLRRQYVKEGAELATELTTRYSLQTDEETAEPAAEPDGEALPDPKPDQ